MDKHEVLRAAADYIAENGLAKGTLYSFGDKAADEEPSACALGAIRQVTGYDEWRGGLDADFKAATKHLGQYLREQGEIPSYYDSIRDPSTLIPEWNDSPKRTAEDVILAMKKAAADE